MIWKTILAMFILMLVSAGTVWAQGEGELIELQQTSIARSQNTLTLALAAVCFLLALVTLFAWLSNSRTVKRAEKEFKVIRDLCDQGDSMILTFEERLEKKYQGLLRDLIIDTKKEVADIKEISRLVDICAQKKTDQDLSPKLKEQIDKMVLKLHRTSEETRSVLDYFLMAFGASDSGEKIKLYTKAIELSPDYDDAYFNRARAYLDKKEYDHAIENFDKVIEINPGAAWAYLNRSAAFILKEEHNLAIKDIIKSIEIDPDNAGSYYKLACAYALKVQKEDALKYLQIAADKGYDNVETVKTDDDLSKLRDDARFAYILRQIEGNVK